jgi:hypothetical protein
VRKIVDGKQQKGHLEMKNPGKISVGKLEMNEKSKIKSKLHQIKKRIDKLRMGKKYKLKKKKTNKKKVNIT